MSKRQLRQACWGALLASGDARFPGVEGRIPNFVGAEAAARRLPELPAWRRAKTIKCNPDSPQRPARHLALKEGKRIYLAVPRLADEKPFLLLDPARLKPAELWPASSIRGAFALGRPLALEEMEPVDLILTGCVGVGRDGARLGKGGGYSDLEYGLLREAELAGPRTPIVTTVHPSQLLDEGTLPMAPHDLSLDVAVTPEELLRLPRRHRRPSGILWEALDDERHAAIPVLAALAPRTRPRRDKKRQARRTRSAGGT